MCLFNIILDVKNFWGYVRRNNYFDIYFQYDFADIKPDIMNNIEIILILNLIHFIKIIDLYL